MKKTIGIVGGDRRQAELARLLAADGRPVFTYGLKRWEGPEPVALDQAASCEVVVLPLPLCKDEDVLSCEGDRITTAELFRRFRPEQRILAGNIRPQQHREAERLGLQLEDYFLREEVTVANAAVTAEAAIQVAMERLEQTLMGMDCLVLGFGRIGKLLCHRLNGLGTRVTATARTAEDLAWIRAFGWEALRTDALDGALGRFSVVFNTIPAPVLGETLLRQLPDPCLCIDLASRQGIDPAAAERLGLTAIWARALPGRLKPRAAAEILRDAICAILMEGDIA